MSLAAASRRFSLVTCAVLFALAIESAQAQPSEDTLLMSVPGTWEVQSSGRLPDYDGIAWYRCNVRIPAGWADDALRLRVEKIDDAHEVYVNGKKIGGAGAFPPQFASGADASNELAIPAETVTANQYNVIAIRVYDQGGKGGFQGTSPAVVHKDQAISLAGKWEFRTEDDLTWAEPVPGLQPSVAMFSKAISLADLARLAEIGDTSGPLSPENARTTFTVADDLEFEQVLAEPEIAQPVFFNFDERGRMWVVEYRQYPYPAGLKMVSKDEFWRTVFDKVPPAPPNHFRGRDRISIHEDTDGDGTFDNHKVFVDGLSIVTSCERGRGGVWVLNPPYLLFYPDRDNNDVPDGDPEVHLEGFGIEDTHSCANSLRWGPDGWLYACQGSTVSGHILRPGLDKQPVHSMGQLIWRYQPDTRRYEIFAEGGGNTFGCEIDDAGRVFSGTNGGDTRGFHYVQGGYSRKGFTKHGPLSNPYAFGFFEPMKHHSVPRFTHNFVIYGGAALPDAYQGKLFGVEPLQGRVVMSDVDRDGTSFKTKDVGHPVTSTDPRFCPVEIKVGPDGAVYVADFYEPQDSHRQHYEGQIDNYNGRIYRLKAKGASPIKPFDLGKRSTPELVETLKNPNRWFRQTAVRLIGDRRDSSIVPELKREIAAASGQFAVELVWALYQSGGLDDQTAHQLLQHDEPQVRLWTVRLLCDERQVPPAIASQLVELARNEAYADVRSQLACSARRLPTDQSMPIVANLLRHDEDVQDVYLPLLLWWAVETKCGGQSESVLAMFADQELWKTQIVRDHILNRLMQRFAQAGSRNDLLVCAKLFSMSPDAESTALLMKGFEEAFKGRSLTGLPAELTAALIKSGGGSLTLRIRQGDAAAVKEALSTLQSSTDAKQSAELAQIFGEVQQPECVPVLLDVLSRTSDESLQSGILAALQSYSDESIGSAVISAYAKMPEDVRRVAETLLASRAVWAKQFLQAIGDGKIAAKSIPLDVVRKMTVHADPEIAAALKTHWQDVEGASTTEMQAQVEHYSAVLKNSSGNPYDGKVLYTKTCAKCHLLFGDGGRIGPDLTTYKRDDMLNILINVVNPSAEVREGFESFLVVTADGRTASGFLFDQDNNVVVLRGADGQNITIPRDQVEEMIRQKQSLMPEGLLKDLSEQDVRNLFAYLRSSQPLNN